MAEYRPVPAEFEADYREILNYAFRLHEGPLGPDADEHCYPSFGERRGLFEADFTEVGDARGLGLMQGLELVDPDTTGPLDVAPAPDPELAKHVSARLRDEGVVMGVGGFYKNVMRIQPPLAITRDQLETALTELRAALDAET